MLREGLRYFVASGLALGVDLALFSAQIRLAGVPYLYAAPVAFAAGILIMYLLCTRWVFAYRRLAQSRMELGLFVGLALAGLLLNQLAIWLAVEAAHFAYEAAKLAAAGVVFTFNFATRKLLLFTRFGSPA